MRRIFCILLLVILSGSLAAQTKNTRCYVQFCTVFVFLIAIVSDLLGQCPGFEGPRGPQDGRKERDRSAKMVKPRGD